MAKLLYREIVQRGALRKYTGIVYHDINSIRKLGKTPDDSINLFGYISFDEKDLLRATLQTFALRMVRFAVRCVMIIQAEHSMPLGEAIRDLQSEPANAAGN